MLPILLFLGGAALAVGLSPKRQDPVSAKAYDLGVTPIPTPAPSPAPVPVAFIDMELVSNPGEPQHFQALSTYHGRSPRGAITFGSAVPLSVQESPFAVVPPTSVVSRSGSARGSTVPKSFVYGAAGTAPVVIRVKKKSRLSKPTCARDIALFGSEKDFSLIAREWPGLFILDGWLAVHGVDLVLDPGPCGRRESEQVQDGRFFETIEDSQLLKWGEAIRLHPSMFVVWEPARGIPGKNDARKIHLTELGEYRVFSRYGQWVDVPISQQLVYDRGGFLASPISAQSDMASIGLAYGDSDRVLATVRVQGDGDRFPQLLPGGPSPRARALSRSLFPAFM